jgi:hypothetical protein
VRVDCGGRQAQDHEGYLYEGVVQDGAFGILLADWRKGRVRSLKVGETMIYVSGEMVGDSGGWRVVMHHAAFIHLLLVEYYK